MPRHGLSPRPCMVAVDGPKRSRAKHYDLTDEESDFIVNYDIK